MATPAAQSRARDRPHAPWPLRSGSVAAERCWSRSNSSNSSASGRSAPGSGRPIAGPGLRPPRPAHPVPPPPPPPLLSLPSLCHGAGAAAAPAAAAAAAARPAFPEDPGFWRPPPPSPAGMLPAPEPSVSSGGPALWGPAQGARAEVLAVPAPVPAPAPGWPQDPYDPTFCPGSCPVPDFTKIFSRQEPPSSPPSGYKR